MSARLSIAAILLCFGFNSFATSKPVVEKPAIKQVVNKININTASPKILSGKVKGIGIKRAEAIVAYREAHGAYRNFEELAKVKGISKRFVDANKKQLTQTFTLK